jgi:hypothetical protein
MPDESTEICGAPAIYQLKERYVDDHFCEEHGREIAGMLSEGLMEVLQESGTSDGETLREIVEAAVCVDCGKPAKYAEITMTTTLFCKKHRGYDLGGAE